MIRAGHDDDGLKPVLVAPSRKHFPFTLGADDVRRDSLGLLDTQRSQLANQHRGPILVWKTAAREFSSGVIDRIAEDGDSRRNALVHEIGRFESARGAGVDCDDDDLGGLHSPGRDEHAPGASQNRITKEKDSEQDHAGERRGHHDSSRARPPAEHRANDSKMVGASTALNCGSMMTGRSATRFLGVLLSLATIVACRPERTVKLAWDAPAVSPAGYRILVDDQIVMDIPPPPLDPSCNCPTAVVPVGRGTHTVKVIAYSTYGDSPPSAVIVVK
jgi:hypothetical protein